RRRGRGNTPLCQKFIKALPAVNAYFPLIRCYNSHKPNTTFTSHIAATPPHSSLHAVSINAQYSLPILKADKLTVCIIARTLHIPYQR
ncbi:MAG: hypothetical protein NZM35_08835, partial [Chitinophagales bacterium]|nr:hypothetical protein [Chitinophagales bacterium]